MPHTPDVEDTPQSLVCIYRSLCIHTDMIAALGKFSSYAMGFICCVVKKENTKAYDIFGDDLEADDVAGTKWVNNADILVIRSIPLLFSQPWVLSLSLAQSYRILPSITTPTSALTMMIGSS